MRRNIHSQAHLARIIARQQLTRVRIQRVQPKPKIKGFYRDEKKRVRPITERVPKQQKVTVPIVMPRITSKEKGVFGTRKVLSEVLSSIPKDYAVKRVVLDKDAKVFNVSKEKFAEMLIADFKENDESIGVKSDYKIVRFPNAPNTVFIYEKHLGKATVKDESGSKSKIQHDEEKDLRLMTPSGECRYSGSYRPEQIEEVQKYFESKGYEVIVRDNQRTQGIYKDVLYRKKSNTKEVSLREVPLSEVEKVSYDRVKAQTEKALASGKSKEEILRQLDGAILKLHGMSLYATKGGFGGAPDYDRVTAMEHALNRLKSEVSGHFKKETKEGYFYKFPKGKYYVVRKLDGEWIHFYPKADGELPEGFSSVEKAKQSNVFAWQTDKDSVKVVSGEEASKYEVPKRY